MDLQMYSICAFIRPDFLETVEKAFFLDGGIGGLFLTREDHLFSIGRIFSNCLGVGKFFTPKKLLKVIFPNDVKIQDFAARGIYCAALTKEGSVFHWGGSLNTPQCVYCLRDFCAIQISSGENFLMALCTNGQVWAWKEKTFTCYKISPRDEDMLEADYSPNAIQVNGIFRPIILTKSGQIYMPKLSFTSFVSPFVYLKKPLQIHPQNERIIKLVCGKFRVFALSKEGALYTWNEYSCDKNVIADCIDCGLGKISDLRAPLDSDEVIVADFNNKLFQISRKYCGEKSWTSVELKSCTFNKYEAAANFSSYGVKESLEIPIETSDESQLSRVKWLRKWMNAFNNPENSDVTFIVEGKMIYGHQVPLSLQCQQLQKAFENVHKDDSNRIIMPIEKAPYSAFYRFIKFLYHGQLDIGSPKGNIELLKLVHEYEYEPLMKLCEEVVIRGIREDNACSLYSLASHLGLKELKDQTSAYVREHKEDMLKLGYASEIARILDCGGHENAENK